MDGKDGKKRLTDGKWGRRRGMEFPEKREKQREKGENDCM